MPLKTYFMLKTFYLIFGIGLLGGATYMLFKTHLSF